MKSIIEDIVHQEAFKVIKNDLITSLKDTSIKKELSYALGLKCSFDEFIAENDYKRLAVIMKANDTITKSEEIVILLENSSDFNEFVLLCYLTQSFKENGVITKMK